MHKTLSYRPDYYFTGIFFLISDNYYGNEQYARMSLYSTLDPNYLIISFVYPYAIVVERFFESIKYRWLYFIIGVVILYITFLTGSRGGALSLLFITCIFIYIKCRIWWLLCILILLWYFAAYVDIDNKRFIANEIIISGGAGRLFIWEAGIEMFLDNAVYGVGFGGFLHNFPHYFQSNIHVAMLPNKMVAHNTYIEIFAELGVVGAGLFSLIIKKYYGII